ncbi:pseudouridine synthase [Jackrogersella minutella]|nr:pseudouridine synthase [Jackrogersella minutella]
MATHTAMAQGSNASMRNSFEQRVGIIYYVSQKEHGWYGQLRTRFTDFQVHEIGNDGEVVHLHDFQTNAREMAKTETARQSTAKPQVVPLLREKKIVADGVSATSVKTEDPKPAVDLEQPKGEKESTTISQSDRTILTDILGQTTAEELVNLHEKANEDKKVQSKTPTIVKIAAISDKAQRSRVHSEVRRIFGGKIDTSTDGDGCIKAALVGRGIRQWNNRSRNERPRNNGQNAGQNQNQNQDGNFLHFTLYKENRETMDAINQIARFLNLKPAFFGTAGTKDRRAVTAQRVSIRRRNPQTLVHLNERIFGVKIGDFKFAPSPIHLGQHSGNEFVIVLKNCYFSGTDDLTFEQRLNIAKTTIDSALEQVIQNGFINYYGTQRFGTHRIGTQEIGMKILKQDFEGAVQALLSFDPDLVDASDPSSLESMRREDVSRARALSIFSDTGNAQDALKYLPKRCHVESTLIRHLGRTPKDYLGALLSINRGMRTMYVHAYQSLVWNFAASKRWERFGLQVVKGDLVLLESKAPTSLEGRQNEHDEETIHLMDGGSAAEDTRGFKVHTLTEEEADSGKYSIFDVVLPSPGWDVVYPDNEIAQFYVEFMAREENGGLDPQNMLRRQKDFSLPGSYRKLMGKFIGVPTASVRTYSEDTEQLVPTDLDLVRSRKAKEAADRTAAHRNTNVPQSAWQNFVENVKDIDLQESRARAERRKAEESSGAPECQTRDTWVQTSVDGSNKRVKVSRQTDIINPESKVVASQTPDEMQVDEAVADGPASETNAILPEVQTEDLNSTTAIEETSSNSHQDKQEHPASDKVVSALDDPQVHDNIEDGDMADKPEQLVEATASGNQTSSSTTPNDQKIAVILRFALNTSQYATIVLRELEGVATTDDNAATSPLASPSEIIANPL